MIGSNHLRQSSNKAQKIVCLILIEVLFAILMMLQVISIVLSTPQLISKTSLGVLAKVPEKREKGRKKGRKRRVRDLTRRSQLASLRTNLESLVQ